MNLRTLSTAAGLAGAILLIHCGGDGKSDLAQPHTPLRQYQSLPYGFFAGDFRPAAGGPTQRLAAAVLPDGVTFYGQGGIFQGVMTRGQGQGTLTLFTPGTTQADNRVVPATVRIIRVDEPESFEVALEGNTHLHGTATLVRQASAEQPLAMRDLEGRWEARAGENLSGHGVTLQVGTDGRVLGQVDGHPVITGGAIHIPHGHRRLFSLTLTIQDPGEPAVGVRGVGRLERGADGRDTLVLVATGARRVFQGTFTR